MWQSVSLGLCEDYPEESRTIEQARADLAVAARSGAKVLRIAFGWDAMEPERGVYDWSFWDDFVRVAVEEHGITLIPYVCYTPRWAATDAGDDFWRSPPRDPEDFARFVRVLVSRYKDFIQTWELWNEPDNPAYWLGTPEQFAALIRAGSVAVRQADPRDRVVLGGIAGEVDFLEKLFRDHKIAPAVDVVNIHSYFETWHPNAIESVTEYIGQVATLVRESGENEPLWMAEVGYSSVGARAETSGIYRPQFRNEHTAEAQANALARTVLLVLSSQQLSLIAWYRINDLPPATDVIGDDNNLHLGVRNTAGQPKPALAAFALLADLFAKDYQWFKPSHRLEPETTTPAEVHAFSLRDGRMLVAAWLGHPGSRPQPGQTLPEDTRQATATVQLPRVSVSSMQVLDAQGRTSTHASAWQRGTTAEIVFNLRGSEVILCLVEPISAVRRTTERQVQEQHRATRRP